MMFNWIKMVDNDDDDDNDDEDDDDDDDEHNDLATTAHARFFSSFVFGPSETLTRDS